MKYHLKLILLLSVLGILLLPFFLFAKTPTISLEVPKTIQAGERFILEVKINHPGQSSVDYVDQIKITSSGKPIKIIPYTKSARPDETKWSEKVALTLNQSTPIRVEVSTTKKEVAELERIITVEGATEAITPTISTETTATPQEESGDLGITFWIFIFVVVVVIVGAIVYVRRTRKGLM